MMTSQIADDRRFPLRPLRSEEELDRATEVIHRLLDRDRLSIDEEDYLNVLGSLVEKYEREHHSIPDVSDAEMLAFLIESNGQTQARGRRWRRDRGIDGLRDPGRQAPPEPDAQRGLVTLFSRQPGGVPG